MTGKRTEYGDRRDGFSDANTKCAIAQNKKNSKTPPPPKKKRNKNHHSEDFQFVITVHFLHLHFSAMKSRENK